MESNYIPPFLALTRNEQKASLEAMIFSSEDPLPLKTLFKVLITHDTEMPVQKEESHEEADTAIDNAEEQTTISNEVNKKFEFSLSYFEELISEINTELAETGRPFQIINVSGGYQYATRPEFGELLSRLVKSKVKKRFSHASLETLAIIAYRQPVTKAEVEQIRGVNTNEIINGLMERGLIETVGRRDVLGKPLLFGTTQEFLRIFGLESLESLPKLKEIEEMASDSDSGDSSHIELTIDLSTAEEINEINSGIDMDFVINEEDMPDIT